MPKPRLVITAVVLEGRTQTDVARDYGVSKSWVGKLVARYRQHGDEAFAPRSRRPKIHLATHLDTRVSPATISRHLTRLGHVEPRPKQDHDIRIVDPSTGELLRHLTLDPTRDYQPTGAPKGPTPKTKQTEP